MRLLRSVLFSIWFLGVSFVLVLAGLPLAAVAPRKLVPYARMWGRMVLRGMPLFNCQMVIEGHENLPESGKMLIASQHQSAFDTVLWFLLVPNPRYIVKIELMRLPLFGVLARLSRQIGVDREAGASALRDMLKEADRAWAEDGQIVIFPEGTRAPFGTVAPLHPGVAALARHSGLPVIPITTDSGLCWGKGFFGKRPGKIHVRIHPALPGGQRRDALMKQLESLFEAEAADQRARVVHNG